MKVKQTPVQMVQLEPICEKCDEGTYVAQGLDTSGDTYKYRHKCTHCDHEVCFLDKFPNVGHIPTGEPTTVVDHTNIKPFIS